MQLGGFLEALIGRLAGALVKVVVPMAKNLLALLATMASVSAIDGAIQRKMGGKGVIRAEKGITLVISNECIDHFIGTLKLLRILNSWICKIVKHEIKKQEGGFLGMFYEP